MGDDSIDMEYDSIDMEDYHKITVSIWKMTVSTWKIQYCIALGYLVTLTEDCARPCREAADDGRGPAAVVAEVARRTLQPDTHSRGSST